MMPELMEVTRAPDGMIIYYGERPDYFTPPAGSTTETVLVEITQDGKYREIVE